MKRTSVFLAAITLAISPTVLFAQQSEQPSKAAPSEHHFKLNLVVEQTNDAGRVVNTRSFVATIGTKGTERNQSIRTGEKVPVATSPNTFTYLDIGVDFDISWMEESANGISFRLAADVTSLADSGPSGTPTAPGQPVIRQDKWEARVLVPMEKPTVVFSADDLRDKGKMQVEVTATRLD